jgi:hypothetical protein
MPRAVLSRLHLTIQRLMDADLLLEEEAAPLLAQVEAAARQAPEGAEGAEGASADVLQPLRERLAPLIAALLAGADLLPAPLRCGSAAGETSGVSRDDASDPTDRAAA